MQGLRGADLLVAALLLATAPAIAAEPDSAEPSVCSPPCAEGETCNGNRCVAPGPRRPDRPADLPRAPEPEAPYRSVPFAPSKPVTGDAPATSPAATAPTPAQGEPSTASAPSAPSTAPAPSAPPVSPTPDMRAPAGHDAPPAGGPSPPARSPATVYASPAPPPRKHGFLALPYVGVHSYVQRNGYGPGLRIGGVFGARVGDRLSLNGELTYDRSNISGLTTFQQERFFRASVSPLIHADAGGMELGVGPKVGIYSSSAHYASGGANIELTDSGYSTGINAGAFVPVSAPMSIGLLLSFEVMWARPTCSSIATTYVGPCGSTTDVGKLLGLTGGLLF